MGPTLANQCGQAEICPAGQYWHNAGWPISLQHWTKKGLTSDITGFSMSAQQWFYVQCIYVNDEENYKPAFLLTFFWLFQIFCFLFCSTNEYNETKQKVATILNFTKYTRGSSVYPLHLSLTISDHQCTFYRFPFNFFFHSHFICCYIYVSPCKQTTISL